MTHIQETDELYMRRTFDLAEAGRGKVSPNPLVGCVIVKEGRIIGEGFHQQYGGPHAEVNAIESITDKELLRGATLYVNLEPCAHHGKTPPCAELICEFPFQRVVICNPDPNPLVAGKGIAKIRSAGIEVTEGILFDEGREFNRRFFTFMEKKRPYIILKWASTEDGFIAKEDYSSKWISNELSRKLVHQWRSEEDAVMVGTHTAVCDNPKLNVRDWKGRDPWRIFIDSQLKVSSNAFLLDGSQKTLCYNKIKSDSLENLEYVKLDESSDTLPFILQDLYQRKIQSLIVEGGSGLLHSFLSSHIWDEIRLFKSQVTFGSGIKSPEFSGFLKGSESIGNDQLLLYTHGAAR